MESEYVWSHPNTSSIYGEYDEVLNCWEVFVFDYIEYRWYIKSRFTTKSEMIDWYTSPENYIPLLRNTGGE